MPIRIPYADAKAALLALCDELAAMPYADLRERECSIAAGLAEFMEHGRHHVTPAELADLQAVRDQCLVRLGVLDPI